MEVTNLPIELLSNHIFNYFGFSTWIKTLILVSKFWQQAVIQSNVSKQISVDLSNSTHIRRCHVTLAKYKIDTLILLDTGFDFNALAKVINASPKLHTLVISNISTSPIGNMTFYSTQVTSCGRSYDPAADKLFNQVTTLNIQEQFFSILKLFPSVSRLKIGYDEFNIKEDNKDEYGIYPSVREVEAVIRSTTTIGFIKKVFPNLQKLYIIYIPLNGQEHMWTTFEAESKTIGVEIIAKLPHLAPETFDLSKITYHEYYYSFRKSPLSYLVRNNVISKVREILTKNQTNSEYEEDLLKRENFYYFPSLAPDWIQETEPSGLDKDALNLVMIELLREFNILDYWSTFKALIRASEFDRAFHHLKLAANHMPPKNIVKDLLAFINNTDIEHIEEIIKEIKEPQVIKAILNRQDKQRQTVFFSLNGADKLSLLIEYMDLTINNEAGLNAATVAFNRGAFSEWNLFMNRGSQLQIDKYSSFLTYFRKYAHRSHFGFESLNHFKTKKDEISPILNLIPQLPQIAQTTDVIDHFTKLGEDFNAIYDREGKSLFNTAIEAAKPASMDWLRYLGTKIDIDQPDKNGVTPLQTAINLKNLLKVKLVLELGASVQIAGPTRLLPLFDTCQNTKGYSKAGIVDVLLEYGADINQIDVDQCGRTSTPLSIAIKSGKTDENVKYLISLGADVNFIDEAGNTLLHLLTDGTNSAEDYESNLDLLSCYIDVNQKNNLGESPLHSVLLGGVIYEIVKSLIARGADVNQPGPLGQSPVMMPLYGYLPSVRAIFECEKLDLTRRDVFGRSLFTLLCTEGTAASLKSALKDEELVKAIKQHMTKENIDVMINDVKQYMSELNNFEEFFKRATCHILVTKALIEYIGVDVNYQDQLGNSLMSCLYIGKKHDPTVLQYLIEKGGNVNIQNNRGDTPLMIMLKVPTLTLGQYKHRQLLLKNDASVTIKNKKNLAPLDVDPFIESRYAQELPNMDVFDDRSGKLPQPELTPFRARNK